MTNPTIAREDRFSIGSGDVVRHEARLSPSALKWMLLAADLSFLLAAGAGVILLNGAAGILTSWLSLGVYATTTVVLIYVVEGYIASTYRARSMHLVRIGAALACSAAALAAMSFIALPSASTKRLEIEMVLAGSAAVMGWRSVGGSIVRSRLPRLRIIVVGAGEAARELLVELRGHPEFELTALLDDDPALQGAVVERTRVDGPTGALAGIVRERAPDMIAVAITHEKSQELLETLVECRYAGVQVLDMPGSFEALTERLPIRHLNATWVAFSSRFDGALSSPDAKLKRLLDIAAALTGLLIFAPLMVLFAALILMTSGRPLLYSQERVGRYGRPFRILKFRTMQRDAEENGGATWARERDPRATRLGWFLRKSHLDELPQFWNILRGDMALVGPRPERPEFVNELRGVIPLYDLRHMAKPGLTGWAQIRYPYGASVADAARKLEYDLYYLRHRNVFWDVRIVLRTLMVALVGRGSR